MAGYDYSPEKNDVLLKAWNNWKDLCCIRGFGENIEGRVVDLTGKVYPLSSGENE